MKSRIAGRTKTFGKWAALALMGALMGALLALATSRQAQTAPSKPKPTQRTKQKSIALQRAVFQKDLKAISYWFKSSNKTRIVTYRVGKGDSVTADVKATPQGKPFIQLFATKTGVQARTPQGSYKLVKGKRVLPASTDALSVLLLANNLLKNPTTSPRVVYDAAFAQLILNNKAKGQKVTLKKVSGSVTASSAILAFNLWDWLFGDDGCSSSSDTCIETDANGATNTVTINCECGIATCQEITYTATVPVMTVDQYGHMASDYAYVSCTKCMCMCMPKPKGL